MVEGNQPHRRSLNKLTEYNWERIRHWEAGGVTNAQNRLGWKGSITTQLVNSQSVRYLIHIINSAAKGFQVQTDCPMDVDRYQPKVIKNDDGHILSSGLLPIDDCLAWIICPTVFTQSKWGQRRSTLKELGDVLDQPHSVVEECILK